MGTLDPIKQTVRDLAFERFGVGDRLLGQDQQARIVMVEPIGQLALRVTVEPFETGPRRQFVISVQETGNHDRVMKESA